MGLLDRFGNKHSRLPRVDQSFVNMVRANDNGERWAQDQFDRMWDNDEPYFLTKVSAARIQIYERAAQNGDIAAQHRLGVAWEIFDKKEALKWLLPLAENGHVEAMKSIALAYTEYGGFGDDPVQYRYWYQKAAEQGDADAQATMGLEYTCENQYEEALKWYRMAAEQGNCAGYLGVAKSLNSIVDKIIFEQKLFGEQRKAVKQQYENEIEDMYIAAANSARTMNEAQGAFGGLGQFYRSQSYDYPGDSEIVKRAAFFFFKAYECGADYCLDAFSNLVREHHLAVDTNDIEHWANEEHLFG